MSIAERHIFDFPALLDKADELGSALLRSAEVAQYLFWKERAAQDEAAKAIIRKMAKVKERFEECERFGHFHPDYHAALDQVKAVEAEMAGVESIREFKKAEEALDKLLYDVSEVIAHAVSDSVKVPSNDPLPKSGSGSCSTGGCSGGCSSCG